MKFQFKNDLQMKYLKLLSLLLIGSFFFLTSCDPDNIDEKEVTINVDPKPENNLINALVTSPTGGLDLGCITINYTFEMVTENGNTVTIASIEDFEAAIMDTTDWVVDFVYPLTVTDDEGEESTVNDIDELGEAFASCIPDEGWGTDEFPAFLVDEEGCYSHVYPFDLTDLDDNTITVNNQEEFVDALASNGILFFVFPIQLEDEEGEIVDVADSEELFELLSSCYDGEPTECDSISWGGELVCYQIVFPVSFETEDGSIVTANNVDELTELFLEENLVGFVYPITLEDVDGEIHTANSEEELEELIEECFGFPAFDELTELLLATMHIECYEVSFPLNLTDADGNVMTVADEEALMEAIFSGYTVDAPFTVTDNAGNEHEINSVEDLVEVLEAC